jgi:hypothetical protein
LDNTAAEMEGKFSLTEHLAEIRDCRVFRYEKEEEEFQELLWQLNYEKKR